MYIPFVKVPSFDLSLRPEVTYVFHQLQLDPKELICVNHMDMTHWKNKDDDKLDIILVDHNRLTPPTSKLPQLSVIGIIDHHVDENCYLDAPLRWIEPVGSCTSQVTLLLKDILSQLPKEDQFTIAKLALAPILVDTIGLKWELGKTTQKDIDAFEILSRICFHTTDITPVAIDYYNDIETVKSKVDHLVTRDLLRKDYKEWVVNGYRIGTSSLPWYLNGLLNRDGYDQVVKDAWTFSEERQLDMCVILTSYDHSSTGGGYERELAFFVKNPKLLPIKEKMENDQHIGLNSLHQEHHNNAVHKLNDDPTVGFYNQENIKLSRKQIWPILQDLLLNIE